MIVVFMDVKMNVEELLKVGNVAPFWRSYVKLINLFKFNLLRKGKAIQLFSFSVINLEISIILSFQLIFANITEEKFVMEFKGFK